MNSLKLKLKPGHSIHGKGSQSEPEESNTEKKKKKKPWQRKSDSQNFSTKNKIHSCLF